MLPFWLKFTPVHLQSVPTHPIPFFGLVPESLMIEVVAREGRDSLNPVRQVNWYAVSAARVDGPPSQDELAQGCV